MMKYNLILFDFDGTLCETRVAVKDSIRLTYQRLNQTVPSDETIETTLSQGPTTQDVFRLLSPQADHGLIQHLFNTYKLIYLSQVAAKTHLFPGVHELFSTLKAAGVISAIVSNKSPDELKQSVQELQLHDYFITLVGAEPGGFCKPDPRVYDAYLAPLFPHISAHKMLMVGDTTTDLNFAHAIGVDACWVDYGHGDASHCKALKPKYTLSNLSQLANIILD
jgi:phosphoglycolate phosphatase